MVLDRAGADKQAGRDLAICLSLRGKAGDLCLLWSELVQSRHGPLAGTLACRLQLEPRALGERLHAGVSEELVGGSKLLARVEAPALTPKPLAVDEWVRASCTRILVRPSRLIASW